MSDDTTPGGSEPDGTGEAVGSVGVEAVKLLQALGEWAKESGHEYAEAASGAAAGAAAGLADLNEHVATGGADCTYCPVCRVIAAVRSTSPEVREHLRSAASSLVQAAAGVLDTPVPREGGARRDAPLERIEIDDDEWEDD